MPSYGRERIRYIAGCLIQTRTSTESLSHLLYVSIVSGARIKSKYACASKNSAGKVHSFLRIKVICHT